MSEQHALASALAAVVGSDYVLGDLAGRAGYAVQGVVPGCVAAPGSLEELAAVLRIAHEHGAAVAPWGGGTHQQIGNPPGRLGLVVRTGRLNAVLMHEPADLTISVGAGMTIGALRDYLGQHRQMLPLDPPLPARATIGGLIATAADGPRRLGYGTLRELLIGITVVEAGGRVSRAGGMVVKNVSGFDMMKLYHGSLGTLAVIASANFKLLPLPRASATLLCRFGRSAAAFAAIDALQRTQLTPTAAEYLNRGALSALEFGGECALALRAEGLPAAVERHLSDLRTLALAHEATDTTRLDHDQDTEFWLRVADLPQLADLAGDEAVIKLATLPGATEQAIGQIEALAARNGGQASISARALNGVIYARLRPLGATTERALLAALPGLQWVACALQGVPRWGEQPPGLDLMRRIKGEFDPAGQINPGRYVEGL
ncbi:FAD-binding oxidoreductase [Kouleothrix sp.]|uniref:FAD-binding oxidoreductase n=1 Tax=Kouleothrix sp. TaxID=2779161 RepID=UPI00391C7D51